jgi:hypothetical protein
MSNQVAVEPMLDTRRGGQDPRCWGSGAFGGLRVDRLGRSMGPVAKDARPAQRTRVRSLISMAGNQRARTCYSDLQETITDTEPALTLLR